MILDLSKDANDPVSGSVNDRVFDMELQTTSGTIPHKNLSSPRGDVHWFSDSVMGTFQGWSVLRYLLSPCSSALILAIKDKIKKSNFRSSFFMYLILFIIKALLFF